MSHRRGKALLAFLMVVAAAVTSLWWLQRDDVPSESKGTPGIEETFVDHSRGGSVRVAVPTPPEMADVSVGGDTLRQLVFPSLFVALPDGSWRASLVQPGSDRTAPDGMSAQFALRPDARWTNGSPITVEDLRRSQDAHFVSAIEGPDVEGQITVRFRQKYPGWRALWSGESPVRPIDPNAYGGPFRVESVVSGLETVLIRNEFWWGSAYGPLLDEVRLVLVPDVVVERELLTAGKIDVVAPVVDTVRTPLLRSIPNVKVSRTDRTNAFTLLRFNPDRITLERRHALAAALPRSAFVESLLAGEAAVVTGFSGENVWPNVPAAAGSGGGGWKIGLVSSSQQPVAPLLTRMFDRAAERIGAAGDARVGDDTEIEQLRASGDYDVLMETVNDGPDICWSCHFVGEVSLVQRADAGDREAALALQQALQQEMAVLPMWRPAFVAGFREDVVQGVEANGYTPTVAWNAVQWWRP